MIINGAGEKKKYDSVGVDRNLYPYVYVIDSAEKMMVIMKRDFSEMSGDPRKDEQTTQDFVIRQIESLLVRIDDRGPLSLREKEILRYAALGKENKQIGEILGIKESTIKNHFFRIKKKLHTHDRTHAVAMAICKGWLPRLFFTNPEIDRDDGNDDINKSEIKEEDN